MNEPKSPEFYFNKSIFPNLEKSNIKNLFQESLIKDAKKLKNKTFSEQNSKEESLKKKRNE